jgi:endoglycosylceramidase
VRLLHSLAPLSPLAALSPLAIVATIASSGCDSSGNALVNHPAYWNVSHGFLRDADGRAVIMRGANVGNKAKPYFDFHQPADFQRMRDAWGMNAVRFLVLWAGLEPSSGQYDDAYIEGIAQRVEWARAANLLVVLDMHQDVYGEGFSLGGGDGAPLWTCDAASYATFKPADQWFLNVLSPEVTGCFDHFWSSADLKAHYAEGWRRVAQRLSQYDNVVGFDPMNEPYWGSEPYSGFEENTLQPFYIQVTQAVRTVAPHFVAFIEPSASRNLGIATGLSTFPFADVVYSPHSYDSSAERGDGFTDSHRAPLLANIAALSDEAKALGAALWVGEYGGYGNGIVNYMIADYDGIGAVAGSSMYWSYSKGGGYSMLDANGDEVEPRVATHRRP